MPRVAIALVLAAALVVSGVLVLWPGSDSAPSEAGGVLDDPVETPATIWAVGDGANGSEKGRAVGDLVAAGDPDRFLYLGDVYDDGTREEFEQNYEPLFGDLKEITLPTPGNHDWPAHEQGYDPYWSTLTGESPPPEYYSLSVAGWDLISLNSQGQRDAESPQADWLGDQVAGGGNCRVVFTHRPRYSASLHGDQSDLKQLWRKLAGNARLFVAGHEHNMQRLEPVAGITTLIAGAGGGGLQDVEASDERLEFFDDDSYGALRLTLEKGSAQWQFVAVGGEVLDEGSVSCEPGEA